MVQQGLIRDKQYCFTKKMLRILFTILFMMEQTESNRGAILYSSLPFAKNRRRLTFLKLNSPALQHGLDAERFARSI
jgi:hypothetical protein